MKNRLRLLCGRGAPSAKERRESALAVVSRHLAALEVAEGEKAENGFPPENVFSDSKLEAEAILLENAAIEAASGREGPSLGELRGRDAAAAPAAAPKRIIPFRLVAPFFDPGSWFPTDEISLSASPPLASANSLLECHKFMNRQADKWFAARLRCLPEAAAAFDRFDAVTAGRKRLSGRLDLFARLDGVRPPETPTCLDDAVRKVREMAKPGGLLMKGLRQAARRTLGDPLRFETGAAVVEHFRELAELLADNERYPRLLRYAWRASSAHDLIRDALKKELRHGARLFDGFDARLDRQLQP